MAFSPDGKILASVTSNSTGGTIRLWDVAHRRPLGSLLNLPTYFVGNMALSPDDTTLAAGVCKLAANGRALCIYCRRWGGRNRSHLRVKVPRVFLHPNQAAGQHQRARARVPACGSPVSLYAPRALPAAESPWIYPWGGSRSPMPAPDGVPDHADERPDKRSLHPCGANRGQSLEPARDAVRREGIIATAQAAGIRRALVAAVRAEGECGKSYRRVTVHGGLLPFLCSTSLCSMARALPPDRLVATQRVCPSSRLLPAAAAPPS